MVETLVATTALDALRTLQRELTEAHADTVPDGWLTDAQWSEATGFSRTHSGRVLRELAAKGLVEARQFRIVAGSAGLRRVWHYRQP
jgi:transcription initiation factor IIE alpha subunit